jgi:hypothetical protein
MEVVVANIQGLCLERMKKRPQLGQPVKSDNRTRYLLNAESNQYRATFGNIK